MHLPFKGSRLHMSSSELPSNLPEQPLTLETQDFDYVALDTETRIALQQRTFKIKSLIRRTASDIIDIGQKLIEVKDYLGYGSFLSWLKAEFNWSESAARKFMQVTRQFKSVNFTDLDIAASALYLLAAPSTPAVARQEALERASQGETITHFEAQSIVSRHKQSALPKATKPLTVNVAAETLDESSTPTEPKPQPEQHTKLSLEPLDDPEQVSAHQSQSELPGKELQLLPLFEVDDYTPRHIIDLVLACLGEIDLDPCSNSYHLPNIPAREHFTKEDDGLAHPWRGRIFMHPPGNAVKDWVEKLCSEFESGNVAEALALVASRTDTQWFRRLRQYPRCFISGRLKFSGAEMNATFPSVVFYLGRGQEGFQRFVEAFNRLGDIFILVENETNLEVRYYHLNSRSKE